MFVAADCLKCHGHQGYEVGDVRGGISVSVPMADYLKRRDAEVLAHAVSFPILWFVGVSVIGYTARGLIRRTRERDQAVGELRVVSTRLLNSWEEERKRIAHDVHEGMAQTMSAIKYRVESALCSLPERETSGMSELLEPVIAIVQDGVSDIRRMASRLRPMMLDDMGILPTIGWLCREIGKAHPSLRIATRLQIEEEQVPEPLKIVIYRILENGLGLLARDGRRAGVEISLLHESGGIELIVRTGEGGSVFPQGSSGKNTGQAAGISTMKELAILSGGTFSMTAGEGEGDVLRVSWPPPDRSS